MVKAELQKKLKAIVVALAALAAKDSLTEAEAAEFDAKNAEANALKAQIARLDAVEAHDTAVTQVTPVARPAVASRSVAPAPERQPVENPGFRSIGELAYCARFQPTDSRIVALQQMNVGTDGGLMIPDEYNPMLREVSPQEAIFRPRATVIPAGESPDAALTMPALDQGSSTNMFGGVSVAWTSEGGDTTETGAKLREITYKPHEVTGHIVVTDKLLRNWSAAGVFLDTQIRRALLAAEDVAFINGNGVGRPLGVLKSSALKTVNRTTANTVKYADLVAMEAELLEDFPAVWIANPRVIPKLRLMEDTEGHLIWQDNAREGGLPTLLGRPVLKNFRSPGLGTKGDLLLANLTHYIVKDGASVRIAISEHVFFRANKTVVKASMSVAGSPWLENPITQEDGQTYSPFVGLDVPA